MVEEEGNSLMPPSGTEEYCQPMFLPHYPPLQGTQMHLAQNLRFTVIKRSNVKRHLCRRAACFEICFNHFNLAHLKGKISNTDDNKLLHYNNFYNRKKKSIIKTINKKIPLLHISMNLWGMNAMKQSWTSIRCGHIVGGC